MYLTGSLLGDDGEYVIPLRGRYMPLWSVFIWPFRNFPYLRVFLVWPFRRGLEFFPLRRTNFCVATAYIIIERNPP